MIRPIDLPDGGGGIGADSDVDRRKLETDGDDHLRKIGGTRRHYFDVVVVFVVVTFSVIIVVIVVVVVVSGRERRRDAGKPESGRHLAQGLRRIVGVFWFLIWGIILFSVFGFFFGGGGCA